MPDNTVDLLVRWNEAGNDVPARTTQHLKNLRQSADEAAPSVGDRMATAFQRLEAREPTMVLRRARLAIEELSASAIGSSGPLGRMAASLAMLIPGGTLTLGVVAGVALIGFEIKKIIDFSDQLDRNLLKLNTQIGGRGRGAPLFAAMGMQERISQLQDPGFFRTIGNTFMDLLTGGSATTSGAAIGRGAELATLQTGAELERRAFHTESLRAEKERTKAVQESVLALDKARLGLHPTNAELEALAARSTHLKLSTERLNETQKRSIEQNETRTRQIERELAVLKEQESILQKRGFAMPRSEAEQAAEFATGLPGPMVRRALSIGGETGIGLAGTRFNPNVSRNIFGQPLTDNGLPLGINAPIGIMGTGGRETELPGERARIERERQMKIETDEKLAIRVGAIIAGHIVSVAAAARRGDVGGAIGSLGGAAGGVISALGAIQGAAPALGPAGALVSAGTAALGGIISLFSQQRPKVIITAFEEQAREQIAQVRGDPATTGFIIIGPGGQATAYDLARLSARGVIPRFPGQR